MIYGVLYLIIGTIGWFFSNKYTNKITHETKRFWFGLSLMIIFGAMVFTGALITLSEFG